MLEGLSACISPCANESKEAIVVSFSLPNPPHSFTLVNSPLLLDILAAANEQRQPINANLQ